MSGIDTGGAAPADWQGVSGDAPEAFGNELTIAQETDGGGGAGCRPMTMGDRILDGGVHAAAGTLSIGQGVVGAVMFETGAGVVGGSMAFPEDSPMRNGAQWYGAGMAAGGWAMIGDGVRGGVDAVHGLRNGALNPNAQICD